jgi:hypothetical protein
MSTVCPVITNSFLVTPDNAAENKRIPSRCQVRSETWMFQTAAAIEADLYEFQADTSTVYSDSGDDDLPIIKELLYTKLRKEGYATEDRSIEHTRGEVEVVEESRTIERSRLALGNTSSTSQSERAWSLYLETDHPPFFKSDTRQII